MSLRGIYDRGGVRKQNGHYQSSNIGGGGDNDPFTKTGTYWKGGRGGYDIGTGWYRNTAFDRGITINRKINKPKTLTVVTYKTSGNPNYNLDIYDGIVGNSTTRGPVVVFCTDRSELTIDHYDGPMYNPRKPDEIITDELNIIRGNEWVYFWSTKRTGSGAVAFENEAFNASRGTIPFSTDSNWNVGSTIYLWRYRGHTTYIESEYVGLKAVLLQSKKFLSADDSEVFVGAFYGGEQKSLAESTEVKIRFIPDNNKSVILYKLNFIEDIAHNGTSQLYKPGVYDYKITFK